MFKPDYARLGLPGLSDDFIKLLRRRVCYIAAVTDKNVKVKYNSEIIPVQNFQKYVELYIGNKDETNRIY